MAKPPFLFTEEKHQVYYHDLRVFICGADVSPWITSQMTISMADRNGINVCSFNLSNVNRAFELTADNLNMNTESTLNDKGFFVTRQANGVLTTKGKFRLEDPYNPEGRYSELAKFQIYSYKTQKNVNTAMQIGSFGPVSGSGPGTGNGKMFDLSSKQAAGIKDSVTYRYPMNFGSLIFHKYDPIKVYVKNPLTRDKNEWVCVFTGYLDTKPFVQNYVTGESTINVSAQDIRVLMQGMRVGMNPNAQVGNENLLGFGTSQGAVKQTANAGFFNDLVDKTGSILTHVLGGKSFKDSINYLIFGYKVKGETKGNIGFARPGETKNYKPGDKNALEDWNNLVVFGPGRKFLTEGEMLSQGQSSVPTGANAPDHFAVHFLFPPDGTPRSNAISYGSVDSNYNARVEWASRLELLQQVCRGIDYQFYVAGNGDLVFEFPMYDFLPTDFNPVWQALFSYGRHLVSDDINDEGGSPISGLEVTSEILRQEYAQGSPTDPSNPVANSVQLVSTIFSNVMASRIGVRVETHHVPGVSNPNRLAELGLIEFNKRLANYDKISINASYRPYVGVNRPIYHTVKERIAITESVSCTWHIREEVTMDLALTYTRKMENGTFRFITGGEATPISYNKIFEQGKYQAPNQGVGSEPPASGASVPTPPK